MSKVIKIGFLGLGVVGAELVNIISSNKPAILQKYGVELQIGRVFVRDTAKRRGTLTDNLELTTNAYDVINDRNTDIICECMGGSGTEQTRELVVNAIKNGKSVVMSSKKVLALYAFEILELADKMSVHLRYDATVGGGIPVAKILKECFEGEKIHKVIGILNATSNFICSQMDRNGLCFDAALKKAQELGYAENDPSEDISGNDSMYKAVILAMFSMNKLIDVKLLNTTPISAVNVLDMHYAGELGYKIKPLAIVRNIKGKLVYRIGPCLINENHIAANTSNNFNVIVFEGTNSGMLGFYGQGAGSKPTASAMFDDLIGIIKAPSGDEGGGTDIILPEAVCPDDIGEYTNNLYWRVGVDNVAGRLAFICSVFAGNSVNIEKVIQKDEIDGKVGVVFLTSSAESSTINRIISEFDKNGILINTIIPFLEE